MNLLSSPSRALVGHTTPARGVAVTGAHGRTTTSPRTLRAGRHSTV